jgi:hypothetical protein
MSGTMIQDEIADRFTIGNEAETVRMMLTKFSFDPRKPCRGAA